MKYPVLYKLPRYTARIEGFSSGVNLNDPADKCADNQLCDMLNMYFQSTCLKTRKGISASRLFTDFNIDGDITDIKCHDAKITHNQKSHKIITLKKGDYTCFFGVSDNSFINLGQIKTDDNGFFIANYKDGVLCFCENQKIYSIDALSITDITKNAYVPTVATDCYIDGINCNGVLYEAYNLLCDSYSVVYNSKNPTHTPVDESNLHQMVYSGLKTWENLADFSGRTVTAALTNLNGKVITHTVTLDQNGEGRESGETEDGLYMWADPNYIVFYTDPDYLSVAYKRVSDPDKKCDLKITFPIILTQEQKDKIFKNTVCTYFGGGAVGINGGSRLFVGANKSEPNLVHWSDLNNPLYFPENNFFCVGQNSSPVTALAKQSDMLVIFKSDETYFTRYQNTAQTATADINTYSDFVTRSATFPLTLIHSYIGCTDKNSVCLIKNRLVFAHCGKIYTLSGANAYSSANIHHISEVVDGFQFGGVQNAVEYDSMYMLYLGGKAICMQNDDNHNKPKWYIFSFPKANRLFVNINGTVRVITAKNGAVCFSTLTNVDSDDYLDQNCAITQSPILNRLKTKRFSLGSARYKKQINCCIIEISSQNGTRVNLEMSDGQKTKNVSFFLTATKDRFTTKSIYTDFKNAERFCMAVSFLGAGKFGSAEIKYKTQRGV